MNTLFKNCTIDLDNGIVKTRKNKNGEHSQNERGYHMCRIKDSYGNTYHYIHEIIIAEGLQIPKHLWPIDEKGKRYIVDHITPISNGGTDTFVNLHLIPNSDNPKNPLSRENMSKSKHGKHYSSSTEFKKGYTPWNKGLKYHTCKHWHHSEEAKMKIAEKMKKLHNAAKKVYQYSLDGELIKVYDKVSDATKDGFLIVGISRCCHGKVKTYKGYKWSHQPL